jgi:hypothetical protein
MATAAVTYTFSANTLIESAQANTNFSDLVDFLNQEVIHKDGSIAFTVIPSGPAEDPTGDNQFARKAYFDTRLGSLRIGGGVASVTTDSEGYATVTHGLGWTPLGVLATGKSPMSGATVPGQVLTDTYGATTFRLRTFHPTSDLVSVGAQSIVWLAIAVSTV